MAILNFGGIPTADAQKMRVYYEGTSTVKEGMPVALNFDSTDNWLNVDKADYAAEYDASTAEGYQNEGKLIRVEDVTALNQHAFIGVVAGAGKAGKAGPTVLDIYVANGAIVPVWTDKSISQKDPLFLEAGELTLVNATQVGMLSQVGVAVETVDRSSTAGIVLAKIFQPELDMIIPGTLGVGPSELLWNDCPWKNIEGNPGLGITFFDDFVGDHNPTTAEGWVITATTTGTLGLVAAEGGELKADSAGSTTADDGIEAQLLNCRVLPAAGKTIWFEARVKMNDATDQYYVGLAATDTSIIPAGAMDDAVDKCGFVHLAASTDNKISSITARTSADDLTADVADNVDATYTTLGFRITGLTSVEFYVNGVLVETGSTAAKIPNAAMCLTLVSKIEGTGADSELSVDWVKIAQLGARA